MLNETTTNTSVQKSVTVIKQLSAVERVRLEAKKREDALFNEQSATQAHYAAGIKEGEARNAKQVAEAKKEAAEAKATIERMTENLKTMGMSDEQIKKLIDKQS